MMARLGKTPEVPWQKSPISEKKSLASGFATPEFVPNLTLTS